MNIESLNKRYDKLQIKYGAQDLNSIYNGGCSKEPDTLFIFMNPTGRNIASLKKLERYKIALDRNEKHLEIIL